MNTPNKLTLLRILLCPFLIFFLLFKITNHNFLIALIIFIIASITDHLDGKIARSRNLITDFGKFADPLADKILVLSAFLCFIELGIIGSIPVIIIIIREFAVTSVRLVASKQDTVIAANSWGKIKTVSQITAIIIILLLQYINELTSSNIITLSLLSFKFNGFSIIVTQTSVWISTILTLVSGIIYIWDNRKFINTAK